MKQLFLVCLSLLVINSFSQISQFENSFNSSQCKGKVPKKLMTGVMGNVKNDIANDPQDWYLNKDFYLQTHYYLNSLLKSGKVLYGDEMNEYVKKVTRNVLSRSGNDSLIDKVDIYILKSNDVNAFAMQDGSIFITIGLLAQVENEAQLAFTIAHEMSHVIYKHNLESYQEVKNEIKNYRYSQEDVNTVITRLSDYSKQKELEADELGYSIFTKAGYAGEEAVKMLYVMQYSHLPFDEIPFDKSFFNSDKYQIPAEYFKSKKKNDITDNSDADDTYSSHPNVKTRIEAIENLKKKNTKTTQFFGDSIFQYINTKARFENQYLHLLGKNFFKVIYESYLLKLSYPNNKYLDKCIARGLYGLAKLKINPNGFDFYITKNYEDDVENFESQIEGNYSVLNTMFESMSKQEITTLAIKYINNLNDPSLTPFLNDLIYDLVGKLKVDYSQYNTEENLLIYDNEDSNSSDSALSGTKNTSVFKVLSDQEYEKLTKVGKILYQRKLTEYKKEIEEKKNIKIGDTISIEVDTKYYLDAFWTELTDTTFENRFIRAEEKVKINENFVEYWRGLNRWQKEQYNRDQLKKNKKNNHQVRDSILVLEPFYYSYDYRKGEDFKIEESVNKSARLSTEVLNILDDYDKTYINLGYTDSSYVTTETLNTQNIIKEWMDERSENMKYDMLPFSQEKVDTLMEKLQYNYILTSGVIIQRFKREKSIVLYGLMVWPVAPVLLVYVMTPKYHTYKYMTILDKNGREIATETIKVDRKGNVTLDGLFVEDFIRKYTKK